MGSSVRYDELAAAEDVTDESSQQSLGEFLSGRLAGSDIDPVAEVRRLRRRERE